MFLHLEIFFVVFVVFVSFVVLVVFSPRRAREEQI